jgi:hypothetical protein
VKQREILESVRATPHSGNSSQAVGGTNARVVVPDALRTVVSGDRTSHWAEKIQRERDAERAAEKELAEAEASGDTQPDAAEEDADKAKRGAPKPRITRARKGAASS